MEATLLRGAQEALANVHKHADARQVTITLSDLGDLVVLDIQDDGHGFDPEGPSGGGGFGLTGMRERMDSPREDLFRAVRDTARGESVLAPSVAGRLMGRLRPGGEEPLSPRELEVLGLVAKGGSNKEVAKALHISQATVKTHLLHIFGKLAVDDRTAAVTRALERGYLRLEE